MLLGESYVSSALKYISLHIRDLQKFGGILDVSATHNPDSHNLIHMRQRPTGDDGERPAQMTASQTVAANAREELTQA
jgi:hypothetical protein